MHPLHFIDRGGVGAKTNHLDCNHTASLFSTRADFSKVIQSLKETPLADERTCSTYQIRRATKWRYNTIPPSKSTIYQLFQCIDVSNWSVVWCNDVMIFNSFYKWPSFSFWYNILLFSPLYGKKKMLATQPTNEWSELQEKNYLWIMTTRNRWYNIGIKP